MPVEQTAVRATIFRNAITALTAVRQSVEHELASTEWRSESYADLEASAFMQLAIAIGWRHFGRKFPDPNDK